MTCYTPRTMTLPSEATLLRIFVGEQDKHNGRPLYESIVREALNRKMAGATVLRGVIGFGAHRHLHSAKILEISADLPMVVELVDTKQRINAFLPDLEAIVKNGMITMETVRVVAYRATV